MKLSYGEKMSEINFPDKQKDVSLKLKPVSWETDFSVWKMLQEIGEGENGFQNDAYGKTPSEFCLYLKQLIQWSNGENLKYHLRRQSTYYLYCNDEPVGVGKLRVYRSSNVRYKEGDLCYSIRPGFRRKGFGKRLLEKLLIIAWQSGLNEAILTCDSVNLASRKIIEANRGVLEKKENRTCYYRIKLR